MIRASLHNDLIDAIAQKVLDRVKEKIDALRSEIVDDGSDFGTAYVAGFRAAKQAMQDMSAEDFQ